MNKLRIHFGYSNFNDGKWNEMNEKSQKKKSFWEQNETLYEK